MGFAPRQGVSNLREMFYYTWTWINRTHNDLSSTIDTFSTDGLPGPLLTATTSGSVWTDLVEYTLTGGEAYHGLIVFAASRIGGNGTAGDPYYKANRPFVMYDDGGADHSDTQLYEVGNAQLATRIINSGPDTVKVQVRGRNNQDWEWQAFVLRRAYW